MNRHLAAQDKKGMRYCLVEKGARLDGAGAKAWSRFVEHFRQPDYQTVLAGRLPALLVRFLYQRKIFIRL